MQSAGVSSLRATRCAACSMPGAKFTHPLFEERFSMIPSASVMAVPLGASFFWVWCTSSMRTPYPPTRSIIAASWRLRRNMRFTPRQ